MRERSWYLFKLYVSAEPDELDSLSDRLQAAICAHEGPDHRCNRDWAMPCFELVHLDDPGHEDEVAWQVKFVALPAQAGDDDLERDDPDLRRIIAMVAWEVGLPED